MGIMMKDSRVLRLSLTAVLLFFVIPIAKAVCEDTDSMNELVCDSAAALIDHDLLIPDTVICHPLYLSNHEVIPLEPIISYLAQQEKSPPNPVSSL